MTQQTVIHITTCRTREVVYHHADPDKPVCAWKRDGTGNAQGFSCTACGSFVDGDSQTGRAVAASFATAAKVRRDVAEVSP
jgi:Fe2+ or Zn2+ uptake regulation protein